LNESKRTVARVAQEAAEAERAGTFMGWLSPAKPNYTAGGGRQPSRRVRPELGSVQ